MDSKSQKYDRQLRLWQAHGQLALENSHACLINGTATGAEILKNLVLPGIGSFTIIDKALVTGADAGNNFFLCPESIGQNRAKMVTQYLRELNDEVAGYYVEKDVSNIIQNNPDYFKQFTTIITTQLNEDILLSLSEICWKFNIPLVAVRTYGFIGYMRLICPEHTMVETHPDGILDLRISCPFPELQAFADKYDFTNMNSAERSHVPYVIILLKCLKDWKESNEGQLPNTKAQRDEFKEMIRKLQKKDLLDPSNFDEAIQAAMRACAKYSIPSRVTSILNDPKASDLNSTSPNFWIIARAVRDFVEREGELPLSGVVPDMKAYTDTFVELQKIYRQKALQDITKVTLRISELLSALENKSMDSIHPSEIERFCKNCQSIQIIRYRSLQEELLSNTKEGVIGRELQDLDGNIAFYLLFRGVDQFFKSHRRYPGEEDVETDIGFLKKSVTAVLASLSLPTNSISDDLIHEMVRAGASELHNIAALMGGVASQEIIKILTHQYIPMDNTFIFNGIKGTSNVYTL